MTFWLLAAGRFSLRQENSSARNGRGVGRSLHAFALAPVVAVHACARYNRILDEQEAQRAAALESRISRQKELMEKCDPGAGCSCREVVERQTKTTLTAMSVKSMLYVYPGVSR